MAAKANRLSLTFSALSDPSRRGILAMLAEGERTVSELVEAFDLSQPAISKHLKVLEQAGLIERRREGQSRPARIKAAPLQEACIWLEKYRLHWEPSFDRPGESVRSVKTAEQPKHVKAADEGGKRPALKQSEWKMF
jgi:DNA-binding transcriptional ArsR family regulator